VREWSEVTRKQLQKYEQELKMINQKIVVMEDKEDESKLQWKRELEEKVKDKTNDGASSTTGQCQAKIPKMVITPFKGTHIDWFRFWNQYETEIDKSEVSPVTKFSYQKELLVPKVRVYVDGLPFTT